MNEPLSKPALYVLCSSESSRDAWRSRAAFHNDLELIPIYPVRSAMELMHETAANHNEPFLVCQDSVWIGLGIGAQVERLLVELNERFPNWAACGNRGARWDGEDLDFTRQLGRMGLRTSFCAHPVISLDDNLVLVNPRVFRTHRDPAPRVDSSRPGILLSLECLANGSVMAVSPRLMTLRCGSTSAATDPTLAAHPDVQTYYRAHFREQYFPGPNGALGFGAAPAAGETSTLKLFDQSAAKASRKPSLTICSRTQFRRPEMLERTVASFDACRGRTDLLAELRIQLITDQTPEIAGPFLSQLREAHPDANLGCWFHPVPEQRVSRIELHRGAMERCETDYIWLVDDDDYANPETLPALARCLTPDAPVIVIASTAIMNETWSNPDDGSRKQLLKAERGGGYPAHRVLDVLKGDNQIPTCGMVLPVALMRERFRGVSTRGEFHEDYFMLLLALTSPRVEICILDVELTSISVRGKENTYATDDWSVWHQSYASFLLELLNNEQGNSPFLWQLANAPVPA